MNKLGKLSRQRNHKVEKFKESATTSRFLICLNVHPLLSKCGAQRLHILLSLNLGQNNKFFNDCVAQGEEQIYYYIELWLSQRNLKVSCY